MPSLIKRYGFLDDSTRLLGRNKEPVRSRVIICLRIQIAAPMIKCVTLNNVHIAVERFVKLQKEKNGLNVTTALNRFTKNVEK